MMSKNSKITVLVLVMILVLGLIWYPGYKMQSEQRAKLVLDNKLYQLDQLVLENHDCPQVINEAQAFLQTHSDAEGVWNLLGACQFDMAEFEKAKTSFQKVISINPIHEAAKGYLAKIEKMQSSSGGISVSSMELPFDVTEYENIFNIRFNNTLKLEKVVKRPSNIPLYLLATYTSTKNFDQTVLYLKTELKKVNPEFSSSDTGSSVVLATGDEKENRIITVEKGPEVKLTVNYQKFK